MSARKSPEKHGMTRSSEYAIWKGMKTRCHKPTGKNYSLYGGRGIRVCERWHSFSNFLADMGPRPPGMTIDRIDNDGDYEPSNCRWATVKEQGRNTSKNVVITAGGMTACLAEWAERSGLPSRTIRHRLRIGWSPDQAVSAPLRRVLVDRAPGACVDCSEPATSTIRCDACRTKHNERAKASRARKRATAPEEKR